MRAKRTLFPTYNALCKRIRPTQVQHRGLHLVRLGTPQTGQTVHAESRVGWGMALESLHVQSVCCYFESRMSACGVSQSSTVQNISS